MWVLADLIPVLEDDQAAEALARAIDVVRKTRGNLSYAACRLRRPCERAEELWRAGDEMRPAEALAVALGSAATGAASIMSPGSTRTIFDFAGPSKPSQRWHGGSLTRSAAPSIARGLELAFGTLSGVESAQEAVLTSEMNQDIFGKALLPGINDDGLLSVLPRRTRPSRATGCGRW